MGTVIASTAQRYVATRLIVTKSLLKDTVKIVDGYRHCEYRAAVRSNPIKLFDTLCQVLPLRIHRIDQVQLFLPRSTLNLFFPFYSTTNCLVNLKPDQLINAVPLCKTVIIAFVLVFFQPFAKITCHPRIKDLIIPAG